MTCADRGFTLVELVLTLILVSILAALGIGLFATKDSYVARTVADQIISQARLAQQVALGRHEFDSLSGNPLTTTFFLSRSSDQLSLNVTQGAYASQRQIDAQTVTVTWKTSATNSCSGGTTVSSSSFNLAFNQKADTPGNRLICVKGKQHIPVCITRLGFAYEGVCES